MKVKILLLNKFDLNYKDPFYSLVKHTPEQ